MLIFSFYFIFKLKFHQKKGLEIIQDARSNGAPRVLWTQGLLYFFEMPTYGPVLCVANHEVRVPALSIMYSVSN